MTETRKPGRPRSTQADAAILTTTLELLASEGLRGLSVERVADRAGVGKTTVYRRFPSKRHLVVAAVRSLRSSEPDVAPDTGTVRGDFAEIGRRRVEIMRSTPAARLIPRLLAESGDDPDLHREIVDVFIRPARDQTLEVLRRGIDRGEVRADLDQELAVDLLTGAVVYRLLLSRADVRAVKDVPDRAMELLLEGAGRRTGRRRATG